jgi:ribosomal protein S6--L-glutamate ligase
LVLQNTGLRLVHGNQNLDLYDAVLPRFGPMWQRQGGNVVVQLERQGLVSLNTAKAMALARDKLQCLQLFEQQAMPFPKSASIESMQSFDAVLDAEFQFPLLLKLNQSSQGFGVAQFADKASLQRRAAELYLEEQSFLIQEFLSEACGVDFRLLVINNEVVAAMQRTAVPGDFRANIHLGGQASAHVAGAEEIRLALKATAICGLDVAGVDIIYGKNGPMLLEVNACPGFEALERVSGVDVAEKMIDFLRSKNKNGK